MKTFYTFFGSLAAFAFGLAFYAAYFISDDIAYQAQESDFSSYIMQNGFAGGATDAVIPVQWNIDVISQYQKLENVSFIFPGEEGNPLPNILVVFDNPSQPGYIYSVVHDGGLYSYQGSINLSGEDLQIRSAPSVAALETAPWQTMDYESDGVCGGRYFQWRTMLTKPAGNLYVDADYLVYSIINRVGISALILDEQDNTIQGASVTIDGKPINASEGYLYMHEPYKASKTSYVINVSKEGYKPISDTINVSCPTAYISREYVLVSINSAKPSTTQPKAVNPGTVSKLPTGTKAPAPKATPKAQATPAGPSAPTQVSPPRLQRFNAVQSGELVRIAPADMISLKGETLPYAQIKLYFYSEPVVVTVQADATGEWFYVAQNSFEVGEHRIEAEVSSDTMTSEKVEIARFEVVEAVAAAESKPERSMVFVGALVVGLISVLAIVGGVLYAKKHRGSGSKPTGGQGFGGGGDIPPTEQPRKIVTGPDGLYPVPSDDVPQNTYR